MASHGGAGSNGTTGRASESSEGRPFIVGVGASAGGLEAVQSFLGGLPPGSGVAVVVVFHLDPAAKSSLPDVLTKHTRLPVSEATDGQRVERDRVYTAPADRLVTIQDGCFHLAPFESPTDRRTPIDHLLHSLAEDQKGWAAAVILSGAGSDGTLGLKAVSDAGGVTFVQEPATAKYDSMPQSALASGAVDHVLPADALAAEAVATAVHTRAIATRTPDADLVREAQDALPVVCDLLLKARGHNFRHYKTSTLVRRLVRRVQVLRLRTVGEYVDRLRASEGEANQLFGDLLINVTAFFRDPEAFAVLTREVLPELFGREGGDRGVRVWCAGCATGEEAYTLAMLVREFLDGVPEPRPKVQIFATDIDEEALAFARQGAYPVGVADEVGAERLKRFFVKKGQQYHVCKELRELVLFSAHNVINDPPFSRLDLICCRNLLIYLGSHLQKKLIPLFHYALRPGGYLFLGSSESLSSHRELFRPLDAKHRISQRLPTAIRPPGLPVGRSALHPPVRPPNVAPTADPDTYLLMQRIILDEFAPKAVVVNEDGQIVSASGNLEKYLTVSAGAFHNSLTRLVREGLRVGVRSALAEGRKVRRKVTHEGLSVRTDAGVQRVMVTVQPMPQMGEDAGLFIVVFQDVGLPLSQESPERTVGGEDAALIEQLERELTSTRDDLERTVQDLEAANEELKSGNEELLSMNEELQSANEELETSKEEVQAANDALSLLNSDLENLLVSTQIATLFLDAEGNLRRVTPTAAGVYRLRPEDTGRPLADFTHHAKQMPPLPDFAAVCEASRPAEDEVDMLDGSVLLRRVLPYRNRLGAAEGLVVTFTDITERRRAAEDQRRLAAIVESTDDVIVSKTLDGVVRTWNAAAERLFGYSAAEMVGRPVTRIIPPDRLDEEADILARLARGERIEPFETVREAKGGRRVDVSVTISPLRDEGGRVVGGSKIARDISGRKRAEAALRAAEDRAEFVRRASGVGFWYCDLPFDVLHWDERVKEHFWLPPDAHVTIDTFYARIHPDDREPTRRAIERSIGDHTGYDVFYRTVNPDTGEEKWVRAIGRTAYAADGTPTRFDGVTLDVTERKRAEEGLRRSEEMYRATFDTAAVGIAHVGLDGRWLRFNDAVCDITGYAREELTGRPFADITHPDDVDADWAQTRRLLAGQIATYTMDKRYVRKGGGLVWVTLTVSLLRAADGRPLNFISVIEDITPRKRAEEGLRRSEGLLRAFYTASPVMMGVVELTADGDILHLYDNPASCRFFGVPADGTRDHRASALGATPDTVRAWRERYLESEAAGGPVAFDHPFGGPDPGRWLAAAVAPLGPQPDGRPRFCYVAQDVTDQRRSAETLRASESRYRTLFESMDEGFCVIEVLFAGDRPVDYRFLEVNPAFETQTGMRDVTGRRMLEFVPAIEEHWLANYGRVAVTGRPIRFAGEYKGLGRWFDVYALRVGGEDSRKVAVLFTDITARRQAEEALRDETRVVETLNAIGTKLAAELDLNRLLQLVTDEVTGLTGAAFGAFFYNGTDDRGDAYLLYTLAGAPREAFSKFPSPRATAIFEPTFRGAGTVRLDDVTQDPRFGQNPPYHGHPAGHLPVRSYLAVPVKTRSGEVLGGLFLGHPQAGVFTARHQRLAEGVAAQAAVAIDNARLYEQLREQDKRKDEFLATLAHELRNPLAPLRSGLAALKLGVAAGEKTDALLGRMDRQLSQLVHLVDDLLDVSRVSSGKITLKREHLDVREVVAATLEGCRQVLDAVDHQFSTRLSDHPLPVVGDKTRLIQVLTNLLTNSAKYTPNGGRITLTAEREGNEVVVRVADSGVGIPADMLPKVFDLFTQVGHHLDRAQGGLGIGLSLVKRMVEMHGGTVTAESPGTGRGSTFTVRLPLATAPAEAPPVRPEPPPPPAGRPSHRVLVVDDNRDGAESLALLLTMMGHAVRTAHDGPAALAEARAFLPQVTFLDIGLPGMNGYDVARAFRADEGLRGALLVAVTGWGSDEDKKRSRDAGFDHHLTKPAQLESVLHVLATVR